MVLTYLPVVVLSFLLLDEMLCIYSSNLLSGYQLAYACSTVSISLVHRGSSKMPLANKVLLHCY